MDGFDHIDSYSYENTTWADQLTSVNGRAITYDAAGNRTSYDGWTYVWEAGRRLKRMTKDGSVIDYKYDADGIRTQKTVNNVTTQYTTVDGRITGQNDGTSQLYFRYDSNGRAYGMTINHGGSWKNITNYFYMTNAQGDVVGLIDESGALLCTYEYDEWGNLLSIEGDQTLANLNPIRYRGYYLDQETGLYYLQSRYYDPSVMRFINADEPAVLQLGLDKKGDYNLFSYCKNDPINNYDPNGRFSVPSWTISVAIDGIIIWLAGWLNATWMGIMAPVKYMAKNAALAFFKRSIVPAVKNIAGTVARVAAQALIWIGKKALAASINIGIMNTIGALTSNGSRFLSACLSLGGFIAALADYKSDNRFDGWIRLW